MAIFPTLLEIRSRETTKTSGLTGDHDFWYSVVGTGTKAGVQISEKTALKYLTVARCVMLISADLARLPLILYRRFPDGSKERMIDHPLYDVLHDAPNPETNSFQWRESGNGHIELWGNHYSEIKRNNYTGDVQALVQIDNPGIVTVKRNPQGVIEYRWRDEKGHHIKRRDQMFHVPGFGFNGIIGLSVIGGMIRESIGLGMANDEFAARYFGQGMHLGGVMNIPHDLGDDEKEYKKRLREEYAGLMQSHGILITQNEETFTQLKMPLRDAQFLEGREFQKQEIAGFYGVPGHKVGIYQANTNRNNTEQENQSYLDGCLMHRIRRYETCISQQLLSKKDRKFGLFAEFNVAGLLRADVQARSEYYTKLFRIAGITPNQIAMKENMNPIGPEGDQRFVELNMIPLDMAGELPQSGTENKSQRAIEYRAGIIVRDRISKQYYPLFVRAAEKIVNLEANAVKRKVDQYRKQRAKPEMKKWLNEFYKDMPDKIKREIGPVFESFALAVINASAVEIGIDPAETDFKKFISDYIETYALRHASSSQGQLEALLEGELEDLEIRVDEWSETRPEKIANNETVRGSSAFFQVVVFSAGLATYWRIRGAKTCPYCKSLNGKKVRQGESFVNDGDKIKVEGHNPMKIRGIKAHPPLHQGCDCYLST